MLKSESGSDEAIGASESKFPENPIVRTGPYGEICVWYPKESTYQFWDWAESSSFYTGQEVNPEGELAGSMFISGLSKELQYRGDSLNLRSTLEVPGRRLWDMSLMRVSNKKAMHVSLVSDHNGPFFLEVRETANIHRVQLPDYLTGELRLKTTSQFVTVLSSNGFIYVLKYDPKGEVPIVKANSGGELIDVFNHASRPVAEKSGIRLQDGELLLRTATFDDSAIYDVVGSWLVYSPSKTETDYYKQLVHSSDQVSSALQSLKLRKSLYTSVKLPAPGPLLYRVVSSVSNSALDKLYKISEISSKQVRGYLARSDKILDKDVSLNSISNSIGNALYSTANKLKKQAMSFGENEIIKVIDLTNGKTMAMFKPPGGISHVSLSPYDLQLVHASYRGDNFYMWDLYKLPREVSLIGKFARGKTSASIKEIVWFVNNKNTNSVEGTNSGFGCITKRLGSIHWYNVNYLSCGNENNNYPNLLAGSTNNKANNGQFLDSWILPSIKAVTFCKLPSCSNVPSSFSEGKRYSEDEHFYKLNQLAFIDQKNCLRLVSPLNGKHTFKYTLPSTPTKDVPCSKQTNARTWNPFQFSRSEPTPSSPDVDTPLSQAEIETCMPYMSLINNKNVEFATYNLEGEDTVSAFYELFKDFGSEVPVNVFEFQGSGNNTPLMSSEEDLLHKFNDGLEISPDNYSGETIAP